MTAFITFHDTIINVGAYLDQVSESGAYIKTGSNGWTSTEYYQSPSYNAEYDRFYVFWGDGFDGTRDITIQIIKGEDTLKILK